MVRSRQIRGLSSLLLFAALALGQEVDEDMMMALTLAETASPTEMDTMDGSYTNMTMNPSDWNTTMAPTEETERESPAPGSSSSGSISIDMPTDAPPTPAPMESTTPSPTDAPETPAPTEATVTPAPTDSPTDAPTAAPVTNAPTTSSALTDNCQDTLTTQITTIRTAIATLIDSTNTINYRAKFVRLAFHDCVGGCDGCVDMSDPDNAGLEVPIEGLEPLVALYENECISRADIWALAGLVGAEMSQNEREFELTWVGRQNCGAANPTEGPFALLPSAQLDVHGLLAYFDGEFGFDAQQVVALMGAHSLGRVDEDNSGFVGRGWDGGVESMDNGYYAQLVGGNNGVTDAPPWRQVLVNHYQWAGGRRGGGGGGGGNGGNGANGLIMLNADIALVRDFSNHMTGDDGEVTCAFNQRGQGGGPGGQGGGGPGGGGPGGGNGPPVDVDRQPAVTMCPVAEDTFAFMEEYRNDNSAFLADFEAVFDEMLVNGYDTSGGCSDVPCVLPLSTRRSANQESTTKSSSLRGSGASELFD